MEQRQRGRLGGHLIQARTLGSPITVLTGEVVQRNRILDKCGRWSLEYFLLGEVLEEGQETDDIDSLWPKQ